MDYSNYKFKGNFGELILNVNGTEATGTFQKNGTLKGAFINNTFKGQWENKGLEGLIEFTITGDKLEGNWKKGLEPGSMKGKWEGEIIDNEMSPNPEHEDNLKENLITNVVRKSTEIMSEIEIYPMQTYGDSYGTNSASVQIDLSLLNKLKKGETNYEILRDAIFDILDNNMKTIIDYFMIFNELDDLTDANYDWFHMDPKIRILTIGKLDLSPIYNLEGQEFEAALLLNKEVKEIEDWVSDFITDCQYGLDEDVFKKLLN